MFVETVELAAFIHFLENYFTFSRQWFFIFNFKFTLVSKYLAFLERIVTLKNGQPFQTKIQLKNVANTQGKYTVKKVSNFPVLFPAREILVSDIPAEDRKIVTVFYR